LLCVASWRMSTNRPVTPSATTAQNDDIAKRSRAYRRTRYTQLLSKSCDALRVQFRLLLVHHSVHKPQQCHAVQVSDIQIANTSNETKCNNVTSLSATDVNQSISTCHKGTYRCLLGCTLLSSSSWDTRTSCAYASIATGRPPRLRHMSIWNTSCHDKSAKPTCEA